MPTSEEQTRGSDRRGGDRRQAQAPIAFPDRRQNDRRSGRDRREERRSAG